MSKAIKLSIEVDSKTGEAKVKSFSGTLGHMESSGKKAFSGMRFESDKLHTSLGSIKSMAASAAAAFGLWQIGGVAKGFFDTAVNMEKYQITLTTVLQSASKAKDYLQWIKEFAASTPFEIPELVEAATRLEAYGLSAQKYMQTLGDTASAMGKPIMSAIEMIADASQGEYERMKEFGFRATDVAKKAGFKSVEEMNSTRENLVKGVETLMSMLEERYSGGMANLSKSMTGMISNLADSWTSFKQAVMDAGVFEHLSGGMSSLLGKIDELKKTGQLDIWARQTGEVVIQMIAGIVEAIGWMPSAWYATKSAAHEMVSGVAAAASGLMDVIAGLSAGIRGVFNPDWAVEFGLKSAVKGLGQALREEFPALAKIKDAADELGESQAKAAIEAHRTGNEWADFGLIADQVAAKMRETAKEHETVWSDGVESIVKIGDAYVALGDKADDAMSKIISKYEAMKIEIESKPIEMMVEMKGKGSEELPLSEKIDVMQGEVNSLTSMISESNPTYTVDSSGFTESYGKIVNYIAQAQREYSVAIASGLPGSGDIGRALMAQMTEGRLRLEELKNQYRSEAAAMSQFGGGSFAGSGGGSVSVGNINITVQQSLEVKNAQDWRYITRQYIVPELEAVGRG